MTFSVTKDGTPLDPSKYSWDERIRVFSTNETNLDVNFSGHGAITFKTRGCCKFLTGNCCVFDTGNDCIFVTGRNCMFKTGTRCNFTTGDACVFFTCSDCTFDTGCGCVFKTGHSCIFKTGNNCFSMRYDVGGVLFIPENQSILLNGPRMPGYTIIEPPKLKHKITIDGKEIEISEESFNALKKSLIENK